MKKKNKIHELADLAEGHERSLREIYIEELNVYLNYLHNTNGDISRKCCDVIKAASDEVDQSIVFLIKAANF